MATGPAGGPALSAASLGIALKIDEGNLKCDNPNGQDPQWLDITLSQPALINRIDLRWEQAYATEYCVIVKPAQ